MQVSSALWFHSHKDDMPVHTAQLAQDRITNRSEFIGKGEWPHKLAGR